MSSRFSHAVVLSVLLAVAGCGSKPQPGVPRRVALIPFENLSTDASLDWMGRGVPGIAAYQLTGAPGLQVFDAHDVRAAGFFNPTEEVSGYVNQRDGRLHIQAVVRDPGTQKTLRSIEASDSDPLKAVDSLSRQLASQVRPFATRSLSAAQAFYRATAAADAPERNKLLDEALQADPAFASAYLARIQAAIAANDRAAAIEILKQSRLHASRFTPEERAQFDLFDSQIAGDGKARLAALAKLTESDNTNPAYWKAYAQGALQSHEYPRAVKAFETLTRLDPRSIGDWNSLAYARAFAGDLTGSLKALEEYRRLAPADANVDDTAGEVQFYSKKFADAAKSFQAAHRKQPEMLQGGHLFRAAFATFAAGDLAGADALFKQYVDARTQARDPALAIRQAVWLYITGRRDQAIASSSFDAQSCLWLMDSGKAAEAREKATKVAGQREPIAQLCTLFTQPVKDVQGWKTLLERAVPASPLRAELTALALGLNGHQGAAHEIWQSLANERSAETASEARIMTAATKPGSEVPQVLPPRSPDPGPFSLIWSKYSQLMRGTR